MKRAYINEKFQSHIYIVQGQLQSDYRGWRCNQDDDKWWQSLSQRGNFCCRKPKIARVCLCVCVCDSVGASMRVVCMWDWGCVCIYMWVCVCVWERDWECFFKKGSRTWLCVCVCVWERERVSIQKSVLVHGCVWERVVLCGALSSVCSSVSVCMCVCVHMCLWVWCDCVCVFLCKCVCMSFFQNEI